MSRGPKRTRSLAFADWPATDLAMHGRLFADGGPLDDRGPLAHLKEISRVTLRAHYGKWLHWIATTVPELLSEKPAERVNAERLVAWMAARPELAPMSQAMMVDVVLRFVMADAPDRDWTAALRVRDHLKRGASRDHGSRKRGRIVSSDVLLDAAMAHAVQDPFDGSTDIQRRARHRDACLVAFLALMPIRARACSELALGQSVIGVGDKLRIALTPGMTKNGQHWEAPVPDVILPLLRQYIDTIRPWLMARHRESHDVFWVGDRGQPYPPDYLSRHVAEITERLIGVRIPAHFFRDAAATTLARSSPAHARLIRPLLGHLNFETADRHYIHARGIEAGRDHAAVIARLKQKNS